MPLISPSRQAVLLHDGRPVLPCLLLAERFAHRLLGYMGRPVPPAGQGIYLRPCAAIHTCFMRFPIDAIFLDRQLCVTRIVRRIPPFRIVIGGRAADGVIEIPSGNKEINTLAAGDRLAILPR